MNKYIRRLLAFCLIYLMFMAATIIHTASAEEVPFDMCTCINEAKTTYNVEGKEARALCHEALISHLSKKSAASGKIEVVSILGCKVKEE